MCPVVHSEQMAYISGINAPAHEPRLGVEMPLLKICTHRSQKIAEMKAESVGGSMTWINVSQLPSAVPKLLTRLKSMRHAI